MTTSDTTLITADSSLITVDTSIGGITADSTFFTSDMTYTTADGHTNGAVVPGFLLTPLVNFITENVVLDGATFSPTVFLQAGIVDAVKLVPFEFGEINKIDFNQIAINGNSYGPEYDAGRTVIKTTWSGEHTEYGIVWAFSDTDITDIDYDIIVPPEPRKMVMVRKGLQTIVELR
jgi:hypothetical protein